MGSWTFDELITLTVSLWRAGPIARRSTARAAARTGSGAARGACAAGSVDSRHRRAARPEEVRLGSGARRRCGSASSSGEANLEAVRAERRHAWRTRLRRWRRPWPRPRRAGAGRSRASRRNFSASARRGGRGERFGQCFIADLEETTRAQQAASPCDEPRWVNTSRWSGTSRRSLLKRIEPEARPGSGRNRVFGGPVARAEPPSRTWARPHYGRLAARDGLIDEREHVIDR